MAAPDRGRLICRRWFFPCAPPVALALLVARRAVDNRAGNHLPPCLCPPTLHRHQSALLSMSRLPISRDSDPMPPCVCHVLFDLRPVEVAQECLCDGERREVLRHPDCAMLATHIADCPIWLAFLDDRRVSPSWRNNPVARAVNGPVIIPIDPILLLISHPFSFLVSAPPRRRPEKPRSTSTRSRWPVQPIAGRLGGWRPVDRTDGSPMSRLGYSSGGLSASRQMVHLAYRDRQGAGYGNEWRQSYHANYSIGATRGR